jgi:hypothetical protein
MALHGAIRQTSHLSDCVLVNTMRINHPCAQAKIIQRGPASERQTRFGKRGRLRFTLLLLLSQANRTSDGATAYWLTVEITEPSQK